MTNIKEVFVGLLSAHLAGKIEEIRSCLYYFPRALAQGYS